MHSHTPTHTDRLHFPLLPLLLLPLSLTLPLATASASAHVSSPTGVRIPLSLLRARIPPSLDPLPRLYDVRGSTLHPPSASSTAPVDLRAHTTPFADLSLPHPHTAPHDALIRTGPLYSYVHTADGSILSVSAPLLGLDLVPLHSARFPSAFVNLASPRAALLGDAARASLVTQPPASHVDTKTETERIADGDVMNLTMSSSMYAVNEAGVDERLLSTILSTPSYQTPHSLRLAAKPSKRQQPCHLGASIRLLRIAVASDKMFCAGYGHDAARARAAIHAKFRLMAAPYLAETCLFPTLSHVEVHCGARVADPYGGLRHAGNASQTLQAFQSLWNARRGGVSRDVAFYYPGYLHSSSYLGIAYIGRLCDVRWAYGWAEGLSPLVMAHELGHLLNLHHARDGGIMSPYAYRRGNAGGGGGLTFSDSSLKEMYSYVDKVKCLRKRRIRKRSCERAIEGDVKQSFSCYQDRQAGYLYNSRSRMDRVTVFIGQEFDYVKVSFVASPSARIVALATRFGMYRVAVRHDVGRRRTYGKGGRQRVEFKIRMAELFPPFSQGSCCGHELGMVFDLKFCNAQDGGVCASGFHGFWKKIGCVTCGKQRIRRQSRVVRCAVCLR